MQMNTLYNHAQTIYIVFVVTKLKGSVRDISH